MYPTEQSWSDPKVVPSGLDTMVVLAVRSVEIGPSM
jgi:hypothetical protein